MNIMIDRQAIQVACDDIAREFNAQRIVLFGSYAYGTPTEDSDADLLVVMDIAEDQTRQQTVAIRQRIPRRFRMDLIVRTPGEIAFRLAHNDWFYREILKRGTVLYESTNAGMGAKS
jgi:predicted nucleotidyltransferase